MITKQLLLARFIIPVLLPPGKPSVWLAHVFRYAFPPLRRVIVLVPPVPFQPTPNCPRIYSVPPSIITSPWLPVPCPTRFLRWHLKRPHFRPARAKHHLEEFYVICYDACNKRRIIHDPLSLGGAVDTVGVQKAGQNTQVPVR